LAFDTDHWTWTGPVIPTSPGSQTITFTATDNAGKTGTGAAPISVLSSQPGALAGAWAGNVTYSQCLIMGATHGSPGTFRYASAVTFDADYQPQTLAVYFGQGRTSVALPAASLLNPGDHNTCTATNDGITITVAGTVTNISRSATAFSIDLDLQIVYTGAVDGSLTGPYHWEAAIQPGDQLSWSETTLLTLDGIAMQISVGSAGTLARQ
jgi:hypothetical protein